MEELMEVVARLRRDMDSIAESIDSVHDEDYEDKICRMMKLEEEMSDRLQAAVRLCNADLP